MARENPDFMFYARMRNEASRRGTYYDFPSPCHVTSRQLAAAGFFYTGFGDICRCAFCRESLGSWESDDDPEDEHRKHYPHCLLMKGDDVGNVSECDAGSNVADAARPRAPAPAPHTLNPRPANQHATNAHRTTTNNTAMGVTLRTPGGPPRHDTAAMPLTSRIQPRDLKARLDRPMAKRMIDVMGFDAILVKQAIYERLVATGEDFERAEDLAQAVLTLQDRDTNQVCKACRTNSANTALLPCNHVMFCNQCAQELVFCQECGVRIKGTRLR